MPKRKKSSSDDCHPEQESNHTYGDQLRSSRHFQRDPYHLRARVNKFYKKGELLGQGGYGSVYAGTRLSDGLPVALKYVNKDDDEEMQLPGMEKPMPKEVGLFQMVNTPSTHPSILELFDWFDRPASYVMAMERPDPCKDLFTYCQEQGGALDEDQARSVTRQLLGALEHCQNNGVLHHDVKPENILIQTDTKEIKLIDFGCGDPLKDTPYTEFSGTPEYLPVEWFQKEQFLAGPGTVWSVGVTVYNIVTGDHPFSTYTSREMQNVEFCAGVSPVIKNFIRCCLRPRANDRPTLAQLQLHPWLQQSS
ncbi:serine/threonine-protein kinase pim-1-like [Anguilla anguilla]|uniref:serine/threonine-protein kinase pim-1-like n=1 Tax=Anguilla anguilla TaxID=7936 RepID=UPI0015A8A6AA|nr:serine/threonine-protein kinase pim-1-like [Anguilla anguilla]